jgi:hypothetical protein
MMHRTVSMKNLSFYSVNSDSAARDFNAKPTFGKEYLHEVSNDKGDHIRKSNCQEGHVPISQHS